MLMIKKLQNLAVFFEQAMRYGDKESIDNLQHIHSLGILIQQNND